jgi:hypothetical protein
VTVEAITRPGRPAQTAEQLESAGLHRVAALAEAVLKVLRQDGHHAFSSVRQVKDWLAESDIQFTNGDVASSLALLSAQSLIEWPATGLGQPRPGSLPGTSQADTEPPVIRTARLVTEVCKAGNNRSNRASRQDIVERLAEADESISDSDLDLVLAYLTDTGHFGLARTSDSAPLEYVEGSAYGFDQIDLMAGQICQMVKSRDEIGFTSEVELLRWMSEAGFTISDDRTTFNRALDGLLRAGRLQTPRPNEWTRSGERPTWYVPVKPYTG